MTKKEVLSLEKNKKTISIIKSFLQTSMSYKDYADVFFFLQEIYLKNKMYQNLILETNEYLEKFKDYLEVDKLKVLENLIIAFIKITDYQSAYRIIDEYKKITDYENEYKIFYYDVMISRILGKPYIEKIKASLTHKLPAEIYKEYLLEIIKEEIKKEDYNTAYSFLSELEKNISQKFYKISFYILYMLKDYTKLKDEIYLCRQNKQNIFLTNVYLMLIEISQNNYRKATIYEAEANANLEEDDLDLLALFYKNCHLLYSSLSNNFLKGEYLKKLNEILQKKKRQSQKPSIKQEDNFTTLFEKEEIVKKENNFFIQDESKILRSISDILEFLTSLKKSEKFRDYLRTLFIYIDNHFTSYSELVYLFDNNIYWYKKERLYDKKVNITLNSDYLINKIADYPDAKIYKKDDFKDLLDIYSNAKIDDEINAIILFPLGDIGVYQVCFKSYDVALTYFTSFRLVSKIILDKIENNIENEEKLLENFFYKEILNSSLFKIRYYTKTKTVYSDKAKKLLSIDQDYNFEKFYEKLDANYIYEYKKSINYLMEKENRTLELLYEYDQKTIKEKIISIKKKDELYLISSFYDITKSSNKIKTLETKSNMDMDLNIFNLRYLYENFQEYLKGKKTFIKIELDLSIKELYSQDLIGNYLKEFVSITDNFFVSGDIFRLSYNEFIVILNINDQRAVFNTIEKYNDFLNNYIPMSIKIEMYNVYISSVRYPVQTDTKNAERILKFLEITKQRAKNMPDGNYLDFNFSYYEDEVFEQKVIDYLNDSLENNNLELYLKPYLNIKKKSRPLYEAMLSVKNLNIDPEYIKKIAKKRNRLIDFEKGLVVEVIKLYRRILDKTDKNIDISITISPETIFSYKFKDFLFSKISLHNIPTDCLRLKIDGKNITSRIYEEIIADFIKEGIAIDTTDLNFLINYPTNSYYYKVGKVNDKKISYIKNLDEFLKEYSIAIILDNILKEEDFNYLSQLNVTYIQSPALKVIKAQTLLESLEES